jgi:hypothetical protein
MTNEDFYDFYCAILLNRRTSDVASMLRWLIAISAKGVANGGEVMFRVRLALAMSSDKRVLASQS